MKHPSNLLKIDSHADQMGPRANTHEFLAASKPVLLGSREREVGVDFFIFYSFKKAKYIGAVEKKFKEACKYIRWWGKKG